MIWGLLIILLGLVLLSLEMFLPSGTLGFLALAAIVIGVVMVFYAPESEGGGTVSGVLTVAVLLLIMPVILYYSFAYWPSSRVGKWMTLGAPSAESEATLADVPEVMELAQYKGQIGRTLSPHQPSGVVMVQDRRLESTTEGLFIDANRMVRVYDVREGRLYVRPLNPDELGTMPDDLSS
jgi:membrane-bound serine protease (ClpP class)